MKFRLLSIVGALVLSGSASAQSSTPSTAVRLVPIAEDTLALFKAVREARVGWGGCILNRLKIEGTKIDIGDTALDAAIGSCGQSFGVFADVFCKGNDEARTRMIGTLKQPNTWRASAVQSATEFYLKQHFNSAGGQLADSTARSK